MRKPLKIVYKVICFFSNGEMQLSIQGRTVLLRGTVDKQKVLDLKVDGLKAYVKETYGYDVDRVRARIANDVLPPRERKEDDE